jgi:hypothetical protein
MLPTMEGDNPYAPPLAPLPDAEPEERLPPWMIEGNVLSVRHRETLPDICLYTGERTTPHWRQRQPLSWTPIWFRIFAVFAPAYAAATYAAMFRPSTIGFALGAAGRRRHRLFLLLTVAAVLDALAIVHIGLDRRGPAAVVGFLLLVFLVLFIGALIARAFRIVKIDRRYVHLALADGAARVFAQLPRPEPPAPRARL